MKMNMIKHTGIAALLAAFCVFGGCPMTPPEKSGGSEGLDPRLEGTFRFSFAGSYEQCVITTTPRLDSSALGTLEFGSSGWGLSSGYRLQFGGDIVYARAFRTSLANDTSAGIIIIKYWPGSENTWPWWVMAPGGWAEQGYRWPGKDYYGIYYINLHADGNEVFLAQSNDQATNYGPTETATLGEAIARFTETNLPQLLNLDVGDPHTRYTGN